MPHDVRRSTPRLARLIALVGLTACAGAPPASSPDPGSPYAIYDAAARRFVDVQGMIDGVATADVVLFGELHDDPIAHRLELAVLRGLGDRRGEVVLGMEMFERDVQPMLDAYLGGGVTEDEFRMRSRPWNNYAGDYRPMVELARERGWRVIATNLPQPLASAIARGGLTALEGLGPVDRSGAARENECGDGAYWERFIEAITEESDTAGHQGISADDPMLRMMFEAQCARDEAMAESVAEVSDDGTPIFHVNGAFHSDFRLGIVPRLVRRRPELNVSVISTVQVEDVARPDLEEHIGRSDFIIFTPEPQA